MECSKRIGLVATLDTRSDEISYMKNLVEQRGHVPVVIDIGILGDPPFKPEIKREELLDEIGIDLSQLLALRGQEGKASEIMSRALARKVKKLWETGAIDGILAIGGGMGSQMVAAALQELPIGFPKVLASTKAVQAGIQGYVGAKDVVIIPSVCDIAGLNRITKKVLNNAVGTVIGMAEMPPAEQACEEKPPVVVQMNGAVTACGLALKKMIEEDGHEVIIFHGIGPGGRAMEDFINNHDVTCCIELGLCEIGNELFGGVASAGPNRLEAAGIKGIPQIIAIGAVDFINFLSPQSVPERYKGRKSVVHNQQATLIRVEGDEMRTLATVIAGKINRSTGRTDVFIPLKGFSLGDKEGSPFWDPESDELFIGTFKANVLPHVQVSELDMHINDSRFAEAMHRKFIEIIT